MFKKKPTIKTLSPLRSSDRRKIADRIISDFQLNPSPRYQDVPDTKDTTAVSTDKVVLESSEVDVHADDGDTKAAATAAITALRNSLLPDNSLSAKFSTTSGPQLTEVNGTVYVGSHGPGEQRVLWISLNDKLYPTVYTLWKNPDVVPLLHTHTPVIEKLKGGADLMTPGLAGPPFPSKATKGAVVAIADLERPSVPIVVGTCEIDVSALTEVRGAKGQAVETFHWAGDGIWDWSTSGKAGVPAPEQLEGWTIGIDEALASDAKNLSLGDEEADGGVSLEGDEVVQEQSKPRNDYVQGEDAVAEVVDEPGGQDMTTQEIDDAFRKAFIYGVHHHITTYPSQPKYGLEFPLSQSFVMSALVQPFLPAFTKRQSEQLVIKNTSWKNIRKFIKGLDKEKLLLSKERQGNEVSVWDIDFDDSAFKNFEPYSLPKKEPGALVGNSKVAPRIESGDDSIGQRLKKVELFRPKDSLASLFKASESGTKSLYSAGDLHTIVNAYVDAENLVSPNNKRMVKLDPFLSNAVLSTNSGPDNEILSKGSIPRDVLVDRVIAQCSPYHAILRNDETLESPKVKPKAGAAPRAGILMETRSGNKVVTRVNGLEPFFVNPQLLADELRKICASSTSVEPYKAGKGLEVMVQGAQHDTVMKALEKRGLAKQWVDVVDKSKKKK